MKKTRCEDCESEWMSDGTVEECYRCGSTDITFPDEKAVTR